MDNKVTKADVTIVAYVKTYYRKPFKSNSFAKKQKFQAEENRKVNTKQCKNISKIWTKFGQKLN